MCLVSTPLKNELTLTEIPIHECGPDCLCWQLIEMAGGQPLPKGFPFDLISAQTKSPEDTPTVPPPPVIPPKFNAQDIEILRLLRKGLSNRKIARHLPLTSVAVNQQIRLLQIKLNLKTREQLAIYYETHQLTASGV